MNSMLSLWSNYILFFDICKPLTPVVINLLALFLNKQKQFCQYTIKQKLQFPNFLLILQRSNFIHFFINLLYEFCVHIHLTFAFKKSHLYLLIIPNIFDLFYSCLGTAHIRYNIELYTVSVMPTLGITDQWSECVRINFRGSLRIYSSLVKHHIEESILQKS